MLHHHGEELYDDLGARSNENLSLPPPLGIADCLQRVVQYTNTHHDYKERSQVMARSESIPSDQCMHARSNEILLSTYSSATTPPCANQKTLLRMRGIIYAPSSAKQSAVLYNAIRVV